MGKKDSKSRAYFSDPNRFADLFNGICFGGKEVLHADDLTDWDLHPGDRTRDVVKKASFGAGFAIIGEESQETVDYSLPIRILESDLGDYKRQVTAIQKKTKQNLKERESEAMALTPGERLYHYPKDVRIMPVVTIVLSNAESWDGPRDLTDMLNTEHVPEDLVPFINGYRLYIVELPKLTEEETGRFRTDVRKVMDVFRCLRDSAALRELISNDAYYQHMDDEAYQLVKEYMNLEKYGVTSESENKKGGKTDMGGNLKNALDMIAEEHEKIGAEREAEKNHRDIIAKAANFLRIGVSPEQISQGMEIPLDEVLKIKESLLQKA